MGVLVWVITQSTQAREEDASFLLAPTPPPRGPIKNEREGDPCVSVKLGMVGILLL